MKTKLNISNLLVDENIYLTFSEFYYIKEIIYKVNEFIVRRDITLNKNLKNNLSSLKIRKDKICLWENGYNALKNELRVDITKWDIASVLEMASTDRNKKYPGVVFDDGIGYGLNAGITEYFSRCLSNKNSNYAIEALVAETLLKLNYDVVFYSYFYNNGSNLMLIDRKIKDLMIHLDFYHDKYIELTKLSENKKDKKKIYEFQCSNYYNVYFIIDNLIEIVNVSFISEEEKCKIISDFVSKFVSITNFDEFRYLKSFNYDVKKIKKIYKRKVK